MATFAYITLTPSSGSPSYRYKVPEGGYNVVKYKAQTENETIGGIDVAMGAMHEVHEYILKLRHGRWIINSSGSYRQEDDEYGLLSDIEYLYSLNNPGGSPDTNVITLVDHYGNSKSIYFVGELQIQPLMTIIEGGGALFFIPVRFRVIPT